MPLPKINTPMFDFIIPSSKKKIKIRPMLVKEEKLLLMAKESGENGDILNAIKQVVNNCIIDSDVDVDKFPIFDLEYLFIKIRSISVSNVTKVSYRDNEDNKVYDFDIDLDKIQVIFPESIEKRIMISDDTGIVLKYPDASLYSDNIFMNNSETEVFEMMALNCIEKIFSGDEIYSPKDYTKVELMEFLENMDINSFNKFREFTNNLPKMEYVISYKNDIGNDRRIVLSSLNDFFTLG
jgi:hypothetical protein